MTATVGSSRQPEDIEHTYRGGPLPAGAHKPLPGRPAAHPASHPVRSRWDSGGLGASSHQIGMIRYRELVCAVARRTDLDFDHARQATAATITVLARALDWIDRQRLLRSVPMELHDDYAINVPFYPWSLVGFLTQLSRIMHRPLDQARYEAHAVINSLAEQDRRLITSLAFPGYLHDLITRPAGHRPTGRPAVHSAPLTDGELRAALDGLPLWTGNRSALMRTIELPAAELDRVLWRLDRLRRELGRGPHVGREDNTTATLVVLTHQVEAVTAFDVGLAHRIDAIVVGAVVGAAGGVAVPDG
jgi:pterin-4a-carbinolamine dehydratase